MFSTRLVSMCILVPIIIAMLLLLNVVQLSIFLFIICLISAWEWGKIMKFSVYMYQFWMYSIIGLLFFIMELTVFQNYLHFEFWGVFKFICSNILLWWILACLLVFNYPESSCFWKNSSILRYCFGILMILPFFWGILTLLQFYRVHTNNVSDVWWVLYILILVWINDSSAYIIGRILGRHQLFRQVSPRKTWEGFIGGIAVSTVAAVGLLSLYAPITIIHPFTVLICSIIAIFSANLGDFTVSMFKRNAGIKDTGNLIPGHGGILDRIDSLMAAIPIFACLIFLVYR